MDFRSQTQMASDQYRKDRDEAREEIKKLKEENEKLKKDLEFQTKQHHYYYAEYEGLGTMLEDAKDKQKIINRLKEETRVDQISIKELNDRRANFYLHFTQYVYEFDIDCFDEWLETEGFKRIEGMPDEIIEKEEVCRVCGLPPSESVTGNGGPDGDDICEDCYDNCDDETGEYNQGAV